MSTRQLRRYRKFKKMEEELQKKVEDVKLEDFDPNSRRDSHEGECSNYFGLLPTNEDDKSEAEKEHVDEEAKSLPTNLEDENVAEKKHVGSDEEILPPLIFIDSESEGDKEHVGPDKKDKSVSSLPKKVQTTNSSKRRAERRRAASRQQERSCHEQRFLEEQRGYVEQRHFAEQRYAAAEYERVRAEIKRETAEHLRAGAERDRDDADKEREYEAGLRDHTERRRAYEERQRANAEDGRLRAEEQRYFAEDERVFAENKRVSAEHVRVLAEENRKLLERERVRAEEVRNILEKERAHAEEERALAKAGPAFADEERVPLPPAKSALIVDHNYLDAGAENDAKFGFREHRRMDRRRNKPSIMMRRIRIETDVTSVNPFKGLSMEKIRESPAGVKYFKLCHGPRYTEILRDLIEKVSGTGWLAEHGDLPISILEGYLLTVDLHLQYEEYAQAHKMIAEAIIFIQQVFIPSFSYVDGKTRLEYVHVENRPFLIILLMYIRMLTNKALHRTALEICKLLINLDPSDPLALITFIDVLALRARNYDMMINLYAEWARPRHASKLHNFLYSRALAQLYIEFNKPELGERKAMTYLKEAILKFPYVAMRLLEITDNDVSCFQTHDLCLMTQQAPRELTDLQTHYCSAVVNSWTELRGSLKVLRKAFKKVIEDCNNSATLTEAKLAANQRNALFRCYPLELKRHFAILFPMTDILVEKHIPKVNSTLLFNPYPASGESMDSNEYYTGLRRRWGLITSMAPEYR